MVRTGPFAKKQRPRIRADSHSGGSDARVGNGGRDCASSMTRVHSSIDFKVLLEEVGWGHFQDSFIVLQKEGQPRIVKLRWQFRESPKPREIPVIARDDLKTSIPTTVSSNMVVSNDTWQGFPGGLVVENLPANAEDTGLIPGSRRYSGEWNGKPLWYSCLGNHMDRGAW